MLRFCDLFPRDFVTQHPQSAAFTGLSIDSRQVRPGHLFVALPGRQTDGHRYLAQAKANGAWAAVVEKPDPALGDWPQLVVESTPNALGRLCQAIYETGAEGEPAVALYAVTGTDGKTTTAAFLHHLLHAPQEGHPAGFIGTIGLMGPGYPELTHAQYTTPPAPQLHALLRQFRQSGCHRICMEVSSQALDQHRTAGLTWKALILTHLAADHLDYHQSVSAYAAAKAKAWDQLDASGVTILPATDPLTWQLLRTRPALAKQAVLYFADPDHPWTQEAWAVQETTEGIEAKSIETKSIEAKQAAAAQSEGRLAAWLAEQGQRLGEAWQAYASEQAAAVSPACRLSWWQTVPCVFVREVQRTPEGMTAQLYCPQRPPLTLNLPHFGHYNLANATAALLAAVYTGELDFETAIARLSHAPSIPGRMEQLNPGGSWAVVVDFAHTAGALDQVLAELRNHLGPSGQLWTLCNASGDRDRDKRPFVAAACARWADRVVVTLEEVGQEDPRSLLADLEAGLGEQVYARIPLRTEAIDWVIDQLQPGDVFLLPSLGDETAIRVGKRSLAYDERTYVKQRVDARQIREALDAQVANQSLQGNPAQKTARATSEPQGRVCSTTNQAYGDSQSRADWRTPQIPAAWLDDSNRRAHR